MDRNREARRASIVGSNGFNRRRHRTSSLRDEDMGSKEVYDSMRLRERATKDRVFRERADRVTKASKRRRKGRSMNHTVNDETSEEEESVDEDEDEDDDTFSFSSQIHRNHSINNHHLQQRRSFPLSSTNCNKSCRGVVGVYVPRKARSGKGRKASTKRSHNWISSTGNNSSGLAVGDCELTHRQTEGSPATPACNQAPISPPPPAVSLRKKLLKPNVSNNSVGHKLKPPRSFSKRSPSNAEELEIEIAEVLYGLMTHSQNPSSDKDEVDRSTTDAKSHISSSISDCVLRSSPITAIATKRKRPREVVDAVISQVPAAVRPTELESPAKSESESKPSVVAEEEGILSRNEAPTCLPTSRRKKEKFEIDLMAPPPQLKTSSPEREGHHDSTSTATADQKSVISVADVKEQFAGEDGDKSKETKPANDLEKPERDGTNNGRNDALGNKLLQQQKLPVKPNREDDPPGQPTSMAAPLSVDRTALITQAPPIHPPLSLSRRKRCATHCYIAKNIYYYQQNHYKDRALNNSSCSPSRKNPPFPPSSNSQGPVFPLSQHQSAQKLRPSAGKSQTSAPFTASNFSYPNMGANESAQYLAVTQSHGYPFPRPAVQDFHGPPPPTAHQPMPAVSTYGQNFMAPFAANGSCRAEKKANQPQGLPRISFGGNLKPSSPLMAGSPSRGNSKKKSMLVPGNSQVSSSLSSEGGANAQVPQQQQQLVFAKMQQHGHIIFSKNHLA